MAHGLCPACTVGGPGCLFGTFKTSVDFEVALALTSLFLPGNPCCFGIKEVVWAAISAQTALPNRCDPLGNTWPLLAYTPGMETSLLPQQPARPSKGSALPLLPHEWPPELVGRGPPDMWREPLGGEVWKGGLRASVGSP